MVEALVGSGELYLALRCSNGTLIAWKFRPARGQLQILSILSYIAAETDQGAELHPGGRGWLPSPALECPLLGLLIHTKKQVFLLSD